MKKRYNFMDLIRVICVIPIVFYHMLVTLSEYGVRQADSLNKYYETPNFFFGVVGVALFFMISGGGLMYSTKDKEIKLASFYKKRFIKIVIPFYVVYIMYLLVITLIQRINFFDIFKPFPQWWTLIFTLLGSDAYVAVHGIIPTFSLGVGEWFLGCLMLCYLVFPFIRKCLLKNKYLTIIIATVYYIAVLFLYKYYPLSGVVPGYMNFLIKIYDFVLGMFLVLIIEDLPKWSIWVSLVGILFSIFFPYKLPINYCLRIDIQALMMFCIFVGSEAILVKIPRVMKFVSTLGSYSYEYFLLHHIVIMYCTRAIVGKPFSNFDVLILFVVEVIITVVLSIVVKKIVELPRIIKKLNSKKEQTS